MVFVAVGGWAVNEIDQQGMAAARSCTSTAVLAAAEEVVKPMATRMPPADRTSIAQGRFDVYNSFLFHAERAADRYGVSAHDLLRKFGAARRTGVPHEDLSFDEERRPWRKFDKVGVDPLPARSSRSMTFTEGS